MTQKQESWAPVPAMGMTHRAVLCLQMPQEGSSQDRKKREKMKSRVAQGGSYQRTELRIEGWIGFLKSGTLAQPYNPSECLKQILTYKRCLVKFGV